MADSAGASGGAERSTRSAPLGALLAALVAISGVAVSLKNPGHAYHADEGHWIAAGRHYADLLIHLDFARESWEYAEGGNFGSLNPQVGKLMLGLPLRIWVPVGAEERRLEAGSRPPVHVLSTARRITAGIGLLCLAALVALTDRTLGRVCAVLVLPLVLLSEPIDWGLARAMTDSAYNLFLVLHAVALIPLLTCTSPPGIRGRIAVCGCLAALASSVKITGILLCGSLFCLISIARSLRDRSPRKTLGGLVLYASVAAMGIVVLNPFLWPEPSAIDPKALGSEVHRVVLEHPQAEPAAPGATALRDELSRIELEREGIRTRFPQLYNLLRPLEFPVLFLRWNRLTERQRRLWPWEGNRLAGFHGRFLGEFAPFPFAWVFLAVGISAAILRIRADWGRGRVSPYSVPLGFFAVQYFFLLIFLKLDWGRYYIPLLIAAAPLTALGIETLAAPLVRRGRQALSPRRAPGNAERCPPG